MRGKIMQYGLTSHALAGNAKIPPAWQKEAPAAMDEFKRIIIRANEAYDDLIGR